MLSYFRSYFDTPTNVLLSIACVLAWILVFLPIVGLYLSIRERGVIVVYDCPQHCERGRP